MNTTAQDVKYEMRKNKNFHKSFIQSYYENMTFHSKRVRRMDEKFQKHDVEDIKDLDDCLKTYKHSDISTESILELCLEKGIVAPEILLLDVFFTNELSTASRNGIKILKIDGLIEIKNGEVKHLLPPEKEKVKKYLVGSSNDMPSGLQNASDRSFSRQAEITMTDGHGGTKVLKGNVDEVNVEHTLDDAVTFQLEGHCDSY